MTKPDTLTQLQVLARERLALEESVEPQSRLVEDLGLDSLRLQALAIEVENHFQICLEPEEEDEIETVADLVRIVEGKARR